MTRAADRRSSLIWGSSDVDALEGERRSLNRTLMMEQPSPEPWSIVPVLFGDRRVWWALGAGRTPIRALTRKELLQRLIEMEGRDGAMAGRA